jgi:hypothetical protein
MDGKENAHKEIISHAANKFLIFMSLVLFILSLRCHIHLKDKSFLGYLVVALGLAQGTDVNKMLQRPYYFVLIL